MDGIDLPHPKVLFKIIRSFPWKNDRPRPEFYRFNREGLLKPGLKASGKGVNPRDAPLFQQKRRTGA
jgi:hypothetical protein